MTGGGSGGHITPILAVASELKRLRPDVEIIYIGQRGDALLDIPAQDANIDQVFTVRAGKFRRYHGEGWRQLMHVPTQAKNVRDAVYVLMGIWQSFWLMKRLKPAVIFSRGGFVSVPVTLGGKLNGIPYVTHDSDIVPSLANRIISRWARLHAVALPEYLYPYPRNRTVMVGIPLSDNYQPVTLSLQQQYKHQLGLAKFEQILLVTGGGNGAQMLNDAVAHNVGHLLKRYPRLVVVHIAGRALQAAVGALYDELIKDKSQRSRVRVSGFVTDFYRYSGASDVIIARGGATNLAEFAVQAKACIIVPAKQLVGGHQTKNASVLAKDDAIIMLSEEQAEQERRLAKIVGDLLDNPKKRAALGNHMRRFARRDAATKLASELLKIAGERAGN